jgi:uncharacterized protein
MIRLIIIVGLIYLFYKGRQRWLAFKRSVENVVDKMTTPEQIDDIMVQDPFCQVYFPQREGIHLKHHGADLYFCSEECRDQFLNANNS